MLEIQGIEPTNNAAERALHQSKVQHNISLGVQSTAVPSAVADCSRSPLPCGNRTGIPGRPGAGLERSSPGQGDALVATGSLSSAARAARLLCPLSDERSGVHLRGSAYLPLNGYTKLNIKTNDLNQAASCKLLLMREQTHDLLLEDITRSLTSDS